MNKKTVWITGASSGIGQEFARQYARLGFRLILTARRKDRLDALAEELQNRYHVPCRVLPADLERDVDCEALCTVLASERIDLFINNAGFGVCGSFLETSTEAELSMAKVNVLAMHQLFKFAVKKMEAQGFGTVLNVASSAGLLPGSAEEELPLPPHAASVKAKATAKRIARSFFMFFTSFFSLFAFLFCSLFQTRRVLSYNRGGL